MPAAPPTKTPVAVPNAPPDGAQGDGSSTSADGVLLELWILDQGHHLNFLLNGLLLQELQALVRGRLCAPFTGLDFLLIN